MRATLVPSYGKTTFCRKGCWLASSLASGAFWLPSNGLLSIFGGIILGNGNKEIGFLLLQGFLLALATLSLMIFLWLPQKRFLYFFLLMVGYLLYDVFIHPQDILFQEFPFLKPWHYQLVQLALMIVLYSGAKFIAEIVGLSSFSPRGARWLDIFLWIIVAWQAIGVLASLAVDGWQAWPRGAAASIRLLHTLVGLSLTAIGFGVVILLPIVGFIRKVPFAWLLSLAAITLASGFMAHVLHNLIAAAGLAGLTQAAMPAEIDNLYSLIKIGEIAFITLFAAFAGAKAHQVSLQQQQAFIDHTEASSLRQLDQAKTQSYVNITHEFRTPITLIIGMAKKVRENPERWFREGLDLIGQNAYKLLNLVNQMLDLSKLERGGMGVENRQGDIIAFLRALLGPFTWYARTKNIQLHFQAAEAQIIMDFDAEKMTQICTNLLSNALKFTPQGGQIFFLAAMQLEKEQPYLLLKVRDTGTGIAPDHLPFIFDRFFSAVPVPQTEAWQGAGIGLAMVKALVSLLRGEIAVQSRLGEGTAFEVKLPISRQARPYEQALQDDFGQWAAEFMPFGYSLPQDAKPPCPAANLPIALLVEDNPYALAYLKACLEGQCQPLTAENGAQGLELALEHIPDIIICDVMMPVMDGFELLKRVKADQRTSHIPVILLTARVDTASRLEGFNRGADVFLPKPYSEEELLLQVRNLIALRRKLQERYAKPMAIMAMEETDPFRAEDIFMQELQAILEANLGNECFGIADLYRALGMSRAQLYRKFQVLTNLTLNQYIRSFRLHKAKEMLESGSLNVTQAAQETGFKNQSHFSRSFVEEFGFPPSSIRKKKTP